MTWKDRRVTVPPGAREGARMNTTICAGEPAEHRTFSEGRKWLSDNEDKAWGERLYLWFIPVFFLLTGLSSATGLSHASQPQPYPMANRGRLIQNSHSKK